MRKFISICFTICFVSVFTLAQSQPFVVFDKAVKTEKAGFSGNKENLSKAFNQERIRLGENFESELWKYLENDIEKHYRIGSFLQSKSYLHGNQALPELALKIWQNGLELLKDKQDEESLGDKFKMLILSSVLAEKLGKSDLAVDYKKESEKITDSGFNTKIYFPALREFERCIYQNIGGNTNICKQESETQAPKEIIVSSGFVNGSAVNLPEPKYPQNMKRISGQVQVRVLIDSDGSVISAEAIKGTKELFEISVEAAKLAKFRPFTLSGKPTKRTGVIVYNFAR